MKNVFEIRTDLALEVNEQVNREDVYKRQVVPLYNKNNELMGVLSVGVDVSEIDKFQSEVSYRTGIIRTALVTILLAGA